MKNRTNILIVVFINYNKILYIFLLCIVSVFEQDESRTQYMYNLFELLQQKQVITHKVKKY